MAFDKKHYKETKDFLFSVLNNKPYGCSTDCPWEWARGFVPLVSQCIHNEDYEGAKGASDAIREFLNQFLKEEDKIDERATLKLPEFKECDIRGIICIADSENPLEGGYAEAI